MPKEIPIVILAKDMVGDYSEPETCAITKAIKRAGIKGLHFYSTKIIDFQRKNVIGNIPEGIDTKVIKMYRYNNPNCSPDLEKLVPEDIHTTLTLI